MAKTHIYIVSFCPAERTDHGIRMAMAVGVARKDHEVSASSLPELEAEVRRLAAAYGQTCSPYVRLKNSRDRKPAGFDAWSNKLIIIDVKTTLEG